MHKDQEDEVEEKPVNELEDKEVRAAASRDRDLDCVPTSLAHLHRQKPTIIIFYLFLDISMVPRTQY